MKELKELEILILAHLKKRPTYSIRELYNLTGISTTTIQKLIKSLIKKDFIIEEGGGYKIEISLPEIPKESNLTAKEIGFLMLFKHYINPKETELNKTEIAKRLKLSYSTSNRRINSLIDKNILLQTIKIK